MEQASQRIGKRKRSSSAIAGILPLKKRIKAQPPGAEKLPLQELEASIYRQIGLIQHKKAQISLTSCSDSCALCKRRFKNDRVKMLCTVAQAEHIRRLSEPVLASALIFRQRKKLSGVAGDVGRSSHLRARNLKQGRINNLRIQRARCVKFKSCGMCFVPFSLAELSKILSQLDRRISGYEKQQKIQK